MYTEVKQVRGDNFRANWGITDLIRHGARARHRYPDNGPEFAALQQQLRAALTRAPHKEPDLARCWRLPSDGCTAHA
ncbi:hypothetical protein [Streptomyces sp. NPDC051001]|uniref:hypothetical protein n=1 Tax=Streptomyces sp. NPDC051001 TaxID=3155795 RepID=UPI003425F673